MLSRAACVYADATTWHNSCDAAALMRPARKRRPARPAWGKLAIVAGVLLALFVVWRYTPLEDMVIAQFVRALAAAANYPIAAPIIIALVYVPAAFVIFPRPLITLLSVVALGPLKGFVTSIAGIALSAVAVYYAGRALPQRTLRQFAGERLERATKAMRGKGLLASFAAAIAPIAPFPVIGMVAGTSGIKLWHYLVGTLAGMLPGTLATTLFADQLANAVRDPSTVNYWVVAIVVVVLIALTLVSRRLFNRMQRPA
jgi:phospholipase D1/2